jgi:hypothetical protein
MSQRRSENGQVRKEEYENNEEEEAPSGPFERASEEALLKRKFLIRTR